MLGLGNAQHHDAPERQHVHAHAARALLPQHVHRFRRQLSRCRAAIAAAAARHGAHAKRQLLKRRMDVLRRDRAGVE
eukprot:6089616-Pleurochrysis_carterae.AAC.1